MDLPKRDTQLIKELRSRLSSGDYVKVIELATARLKEVIDPSSKQNFLLISEIANQLIDAGNEVLSESVVRSGLEIYQRHYDGLSEVIGQSAIEYNIGNAKSALYNLRRHQDEFQYRLESIGLHTEAKNHYWRAYQAAENEDLRHQLLVNLGNTLSASGRIAEALQCYDEVLEDEPEYPQANGNRAVALITLSSLTAPSDILLWQVYQGFLKGSQGKDMAQWMRDRWANRAIETKKQLKERGKGASFGREDAKHTRDEYEQHSDYRRYCLDNFLALSEHGLYCPCIGARKDELTIPTKVWSIAGDFVPKMEHRLNRIKSEFGLARYAFYHSGHSGESSFTPYDKTIDFAELYEDEAIGLRYEHLRMSFRVCFGILDKIAVAICELFNIPVRPTDHVYFHNFWKKRKEWWERLNAVDRNTFLIALYSQATDLSKHSQGEWEIYKEWRDAMEHGFFVIKESPEAPDPFKVLKSRIPLDIVSLDDFQEKALRLLQFTRSAIFNFAFCVRVEGWKKRGGGAATTLYPRDHL